MAKCKHKHGSFDAEGRPSHMAILEAIAAEAEHAWDCFAEERAKDDRTAIGTILSNRAHARALHLRVLLDDLLDLCLEEGWSIPAGIHVLATDQSGDVEGGGDQCER